jgi:hypothetical protein
MRRGGGFSGDGEGDGEGWSPQADVSALAMLLFEIVAGHSWPSLSAANAEEDGKVILPPDVPGFVSEIIEGRLRPIVGRELSFIAIFETLKKNGFHIVAGVEFNEVSAFVSGVESAVQSGESE